MDRVPPQIRRLAKQLQASEIASTSTDVDNSAEFLTINRIRPHLSMLMGRSGFQALLARALVLATAEVDWLTAVRVVADGELQGLTVARTTTSASAFAEGESVLLGQLTGLLVAFIGPALTLRLINQVWPQLSLDEADFTNTPDDEEAK